MSDIPEILRSGMIQLGKGFPGICCQGRAWRAHRLLADGLQLSNALDLGSTFARGVSTAIRLRAFMAKGLKQVGLTAEVMLEASRFCCGRAVHLACLAVARPSNAVLTVALGGCAR